MQDNSDLIIRDCCEAEVAEFGQPDTICITVDVLREIVQRHSPGTCLHQITEPQAAPAAVAVPDERSAFESWWSTPHLWSNGHKEAQWSAWQARAALAATTAAAPAGWKLVPVEPTAEMLERAGATDRDGTPATYKTLYMAMVGVAPAADAPKAIAVPAELLERVIDSLSSFAGNKPHTEADMTTWEQLNNLLSAEPAAAPAQTIERERMTAGRASYFMERFLKEEKLLGPNEQAALHFVIDMLEAAAAAPVVRPEPDAVINEVMELVKDWAQRDLIAVEAGIDTLDEESSEKQHQEAKRLDGEAETAYRAIEAKLRALLAGVSGPAAQQTRAWRGGKLTVADLVNNLLMMDQALPIYGAQYIEHPPGKRRAIAVPPTVSRERIKDSRWIGEGESLNAAVIWTRAEQPTPQVTLDYLWRARLLDGRPLERDATGFAWHPELVLLDEGMKVKAFHAALGVEVKHTMAEDDLSMDEYDAMCDAENWRNWTPKSPSGEAWNLVAIFDTEDGPAAWWMRELRTNQQGVAA